MLAYLIPDSLVSKIRAPWPSRSGSSNSGV